MSVDLDSSPPKVDLGAAEKLARVQQSFNADGSNAATSTGIKLAGDAILLLVAEVRRLQQVALKNGVDAGNAEKDRDEARSNLAEARRRVTELESFTRTLATACARVESELIEARRQVTYWHDLFTNENAAAKDLHSRLAVAKEALVSVERNAEYDMSKADTNQNRSRFEWLFNKAREAIAKIGGSDE